MRGLALIIAMIRTGIAVIFVLSMITLFFCFSLLTWRRWSLSLSGPILRFIGRFTLKILGIPLTVMNEWPFEEDEARVVIVNHQSTLDIVWFCAITPNRLGAVGKRELIWVPIFNLSWWALRFFFIDRSNLESAISTLERAAENTLTHHRSVALSPEGTRSPDGRMLPFKKGVFHLAMMGRFPLYPIVVCGAAEAMPKHALWARPHPISLRFLPPISTQDWDPHRLSEHIEFVRQQMIDAYDELREEAGLQPLSHERF